MSPPRLALALVCVLALSGCAAGRMERRLKPWVGRDIREAVSELGPPSDVFDNGGTKVVRWASVGRTVAMAQTYGRATYAAARTKTCAWWFDVAEDGRILGWHWRGDGC